MRYHSTMKSLVRILSFLLVSSGIAFAEPVEQTATAMPVAAAPVVVPASALGPASLPIGIPDLKSEITKTALNYFLENSHPKTGLVRDNADNFKLTPVNVNRVSSIAATGFGLAVIAHASTRGMVEKEFAKQYSIKVLKFCRDHVPRRKGWFLHWVDWETGKRAWNAEYSTIDSALFLAGALYAAQIFPGTEVDTLARQLYSETDFWDAMTNGGALPKKRTLSMAYTEGEGYTPAEWNMYAEQMILLILGLGHPTNPLPQSVWLEWGRQMQPGKPEAPAFGPGQEMMGLDQALFVHQYSQLFIDFRSFSDVFKNYYENSASVTRFHRKIATPDSKFKTLKEGFWGFSAGNAPKRDYKVYHALDYSSTVCIGCVLGSIMYSPDEILGDAFKWKQGPYQNQIWGRYGFIDSLDLDQNWFSQTVLGITVGPAYMSLENTSEQTSFWKDFMQIPEVKNGLRQASFASAAVVPLEETTPTVLPATVVPEVLPPPKGEVPKGISL
jgi:hypothetical protein